MGFLFINSLLRALFNSLSSYVPLLKIFSFGSGYKRSQKKNFNRAFLATGIFFSAHRPWRGGGERNQISNEKRKYKAAKIPPLPKIYSNQCIFVFFFSFNNKYLFNQKCQVRSQDYLFYLNKL